MPYSPVPEPHSNRSGRPDDSAPVDPGAARNSLQAAYLLMAGVGVGVAFLFWSQMTVAACENPEFPGAKYFNVQSCNYTYGALAFLILAGAAAAGVAINGAKKARARGADQRRWARIYPVAEVVIGIIWAAAMYLR